MTVQELFRNVLWDDVTECFTEVYPDNAEDIPELRKVFDEVRAYESVPDPQGMTVDIVLIEDEDGDSHDVYGRVPGDEEHYALDFHLFREWAGFLIDKKLLRKMRPPEIAVHILWEMTFHGYSDEDILAHMEEIKDRLRECKEHPERCIPLSEIFGKDSNR